MRRAAIQKHFSPDAFGKCSISNDGAFACWFQMSTHGPADEYLLLNSLASVLRMCVGKVTTVELRNDAYVTGRVVAVDGYMNVTMRDAKVVDAARNACDFEHYFVQNRLVRYYTRKGFETKLCLHGECMSLRFVQIPVEINIKRELEKMFDPKAKEAAKNERGQIISCKALIVFF